MLLLDKRDSEYIGLDAILIKLELVQNDGRKYTLPELREILSRHRVFESSKNSQLELLATKYNVKIIWYPKFHCELNPIEGFWCDLKWFVRKFNDQDFKKLNGLVIRGMEQFEEKKMNLRLCRRF